jgi:hypothetical protein
VSGFEGQGKKEEGIEVREIIYLKMIKNSLE